MATAEKTPVQDGPRVFINLTVSDLFLSFETQVTPKANMMRFVPYKKGHGAYYFDYALAKAGLEHLVKKASLVANGLDEFNAAEEMLMLLIKGHVTNTLGVKS